VISKLTRWVPNRYAQNSRMMLCANGREKITPIKSDMCQSDKTIKCWKVSETSTKSLDAKMKGNGNVNKIETAEFICNIFINIFIRLTTTHTFFHRHAN
jgi:hypothetical protein